MNSSEIWRIIEAFPDYQVSDFGRVQRIMPDRLGRCGRVLKAVASGRYAKVDLTRDGKSRTFSVHTLVAEAFCGNRPTPNHQVAHNDGDKSNNRANNLRWATPLENNNDKRAHGTMSLGDQHWTRRSPERVKRGADSFFAQPGNEPKGSANGRAKLSDEDVCAIRAVPHYWGINMRLAEQYGVTNALISRIRAGKSWQHI
jgi:hypothetical protein